MARTAAADVAMVRPSPAWWLWYVYGGTLPERYRDWVDFDTTSERWVLRHAIRIVVKALPLLVVAVVVLGVLTPLAWWAAILVMLIALAFSLFYTMGTAAEFCEVRRQKHGLPPRGGPDG